MMRARNDLHDRFLTIIGLIKFPFGELGQPMSFMNHFDRVTMSANVHRASHRD